MTNRADQNWPEGHAIEISDAAANPPIDELTYRSYAWNRAQSPEISAERWAQIFPNAAAMEARYRAENPLKGRKKFPPAHFGRRARYAAEPESDMERDRR